MAASHGFTTAGRADRHVQRRAARDGFGGENAPICCHHGGWVPAPAWRPGRRQRSLEAAMSAIPPTSRRCARWCSCTAARRLASCCGLSDLCGGQRYRSFDRSSSLSTLRRSTAISCTTLRRRGAVHAVLSLFGPITPRHWPRWPMRRGSATTGPRRCPARGHGDSAKHAVEENRAAFGHKAAWSAQNGRATWSARSGNYRKAFAPAHPCGNAQGLVAAAGDWGWWQDIITTVPRLCHGGDQMAGRGACRATSCSSAKRTWPCASSSGHHGLHAGAALAPDLPGVHQALAHATARWKGEAPPRHGPGRAVPCDPARSNPARQRFESSARIGHLQRDELPRSGCALWNLFAGSATTAERRGVLHELVEFHTANRHWSRAVDVLEKLVSVTSGRDRVCYLGALASILNVELDSPIRRSLFRPGLGRRSERPAHPSEHIEHILIRRQNGGS